MSLEFLTRNWALAVASVLGTAVVLMVLYRLYADSARGRLRRRLGELTRRRWDAERAARSRDKAARRLKVLQGRAASTRPRRINAANEALQDAEMLKKVADDQVLVAVRRVREVILEEFPPNRHDALRNKYL